MVAKKNIECIIRFVSLIKVNKKDSYNKFDDIDY